MLALRPVLMLVLSLTLFAPTCAVRFKFQEYWNLCRIYADISCAAVFCSCIRWSVPSLVEHVHHICPRTPQPHVLRMCPRGHMKTNTQIGAWHGTTLISVHQLRRCSSFATSSVVISCYWGLHLTFRPRRTSSRKGFDPPTKTRREEQVCLCLFI